MDSLFWAVVLVFWPLALFNVAMIFVPVRRDFGRWPRIARICVAGCAVSTAGGLTIVSFGLQRRFELAPSWTFAAFTMLMAAGALSALSGIGVCVARLPAAAAALHMPPRLHAWLYDDDSARVPTNGG